MAVATYIPRASEDSYSSLIASYSSRQSASSWTSFTSKSASTKSTIYSHPLYPSQLEKFNGAVVTVEESRFSSCSTSPSSSCESLDFFATPQKRHSAASSEPISPKTLTNALASIASNRSSSSSYYTLRFADDHYPLISNIQGSNTIHSSILNMAQAHNAYIRAINSCYNHASLVESEEIMDYLFFSQTLYNIISQYLKYDCQYLQTFLHRPSTGRNPATTDIHRDATFQSNLLAWGTYIHSTSARTHFCPDEMQSLISAFGPAFVQYLHDEVTGFNCMIANNTLHSSHFSSTWVKFEEALSNTLDLYTDIALLVGCHDRHFAINDHIAECSFPKVPFRTTLMVKKWHSRKHEGAWKFCSSNFNGKRRVLSS